MAKTDNGYIVDIPAERNDGLPDPADVVSVEIAVGDYIYHPRRDVTYVVRGLPG